MRYQQLVQESRSRSTIVVDVQPAYCTMNSQHHRICSRIIEFVNRQTGPVLMLCNAEDQGLTADTRSDIREFWHEHGFDDNNWSRVTVIDKGYGYLRSWMDRDVPNQTIIRTIRTMYQQGVTDSRDLYDGESSSSYEQQMLEHLGIDLDSVYREAIMVNWISVAKLKQFANSYMVGGARHECLREVELLMNAFNISYRRIDSLVYG